MLSRVSDSFRMLSIPHAARTTECASLPRRGPRTRRSTCARGLHAAVPRLSASPSRGRRVKRPHALPGRPSAGEQSMRWPEVGGVLNLLAPQIQIHAHTHTHTQNSTWHCMLQFGMSDRKCLPRRGGDGERSVAGRTRCTIIRHLITH